MVIEILVAILLGFGVLSTLLLLGVTVVLAVQELRGKGGN